MRKMMKSLIFDLDGTLIDPRKDFFKSLNQALSEFELEPFRDIRQIDRFLGPGAAYMVNTILPPERMSEAGDFIERYRLIYRSHCLDETTLYPGVAETLKRIEGRRLAVATNKPGYIARQIMVGLGIASYFPLVVGGEDVVNPKPDPEILEITLKRLGADRNSTMIIGDSYCDIESGRAAGIATCAVAYGFNDRAVLEPLRPDYLIDSFPQILEVI
jgi:phosphoglycolate phosphatase